MVDFSTSSAGLRFTCPACGEELFLENPSPERAAEDAGTPAVAGEQGISTPAREPPVEATESVVCPKCGHAQRDDYACHLCGLVFARFDPASLPPVPGEIEQLWRQIENRPGDESLHRQFQQQALAAGLLEYATRQYRILGRLPGHDELAGRMLQRLQNQAQARLLPGTLVRSGTSRRGFGRRGWMLIIALALVSGLLHFAWKYGAFSFLSGR